MAGVVTATRLNVGLGVTIFSETLSNATVGIGTTTPRAKLDIDGSTKFKTYSENVGVVTAASNVVTLDLSLAQSFTLTVTEEVLSFKLTNPPSDATAFTLKILQDSTGYSVGIDTFNDNGGSAIPVYWPAAVTPTVTTTASKTDIYSFMTFDSGSSLYGVVGGQNFA